MKGDCAPLDTKKGKRQYYVGYTAAFAAAVLLVFCWYFAAGRTLIWNGDGWVQHYKALVYYARYLRSIVLGLLNSHRLAIPQWDFCIGEGSDILQTLQYYVVGDPFALFSVAVPVRFMHLYYDGMILLRLYLAGVFFSVLCFENGIKSRYAVLAGALSYIFCFWAVFNSARHPFFLNPMVYLPMLLIGVERVFRRKRPYLLIAAVCLSAASNLYFFYMLALVTVIYTAVRLAVFYRKTPQLRKAGCRLFLRIAAAAVLGLGLAAVVVLPAGAAILSDGRFSSRPALHLFYPLYYYCKLPAVFFSQGNEYWTCMGYAALVLPAVLLLFCRKKNGFLKVLFATGIVMLLFPVFGWAMNGFAYAVNRWIWAFALLCAYILAVMWPSLMDLRYQDFRVLAVGISIFFILCMVFEQSRTVMAFSALCLILLAVLLPSFFREGRGIWNKRNRQPAALLLVLVSVCVNSFWLNAPGGGNYAAEAWEAAHAFDGLLNNETAAVRAVAAADGTEGCVRYSGRHLTLNASILSGMSSTQYYWSLSNPYASEFRDTMGLGREEVALNYTGYDDRTALETLAGVRYFAVPDWDAAPVPYGFARAEADYGGAGYTVYRNTHALPLAYTYDSRIPEQDWDSLSMVNRQEALLQGAVLEDYDGNAAETKLVLGEKKVSSTLQCNGSGIALLDHAFAVEEPNASVTVSFEGLTDCETYISIRGLEYEGVPDYDIGDASASPVARLKNRLLWNRPSVTQLSFAASNGQQKTMHYYTDEHSCYNGQHDFAVNLGYAQDAVSSVTVTFSGTGIYSFDSLEVSCLPVGHFGQMVRQREEDVLEGITMGTNEISGVISLERPKLLCLAVPYLPGWSAYVDGEKTELYRANIQYMALELDAGEHSVRLVYHTPWLKEGAYISLSAAAACIFYWLFSSGYFKRLWRRV